MPSKRKRRLVRGALIAAVLLAGLIGFLPTIVGSRWIYQPLIDQLAAQRFRLTIDSVRLRWFSPLQLRGLQLSEFNGAPLLTIRQVDTDRSLWGYLTGGRKLGRLEIVEPVLSVELLQDSSNIQRIAQAIDEAAKRPDSPRRSPPAVDIDVIVRDLSAKVMRSTESAPLVVVPPLYIEAKYRAASGDSQLTIQPTKVLDQVQITRELVDLGLGHAVPLLAQSAWFDGRVSASLGQTVIPLAAPQAMEATMSLTLHQVRSGPSDPGINRLLDFLARTRQREPVHELVFVDDSVIDVRVADGQVHHQGLEFGLPKMDSRFQVVTSGTVRIEDKALDLLVLLPVPLEQLAARSQVKSLGVPTIKLPVTGTLDKPQVNWQAMRGDAAELLGSIRAALGDDAPATASLVTALESLAEGRADAGLSAAVDLIQQLKQRRANSSAVDAQKSDTSDDTSAAPAKKNQPIRDALRGILRGQ